MEWKREREVRRDGPESRLAPPFRCVWSWLRRRSTWRRAQTTLMKKERMSNTPMPLLAFSSPVWHDGRVCLPSCLAPWPMEHFSALQSGRPGRRRAFGGTMHALPADRAPGTVCSLACDYPSNCMGKPDNSHTVRCKSGGSKDAAMCCRQRQASEGLGLFRATSTEMALVWCPQERFRRHCNPVSALRA